MTRNGFLQRKIINALKNALRDAADRPARDVWHGETWLCASPGARLRLAWTP